MKTFSEFLNELAGRVGAGTLADQIGMDAGAFSRFRSGQGTISLARLEKLLQQSGICLVTCEEKERLETALETISELWKSERRKKK